MIDYEQVLLAQKVIKNRIEQQINDIIWSVPFINISKMLENSNNFKWDKLIFKKENNNIFYLDRSTKIYIVKNNDIYLYNLPFHFGIDPQEDCNYFLDIENQISEKKEYPTTTVYKNSKKVAGKGLNVQDYIYFTHFANKNYLTYKSKEDLNKIIFKYDLFYEDKEIEKEDTFTDRGPYFIDRYTNPSYIYQGSPDKFNKIPLLDIYNSSCKIETTVKVKIEDQEEEKKKILYPCFFEGMPLQEQEFIKIDENTFKPVIGEVRRGIINMYYTATRESSREDYIEYFTDTDQSQNIQLRLY